MDPCVGVHHIMLGITRCHIALYCSLSYNVIRHQQQLHLKDYHNWFTDLVTGWIDAAADKCNAEIKRAVTALDDVRKTKLVTRT